MPHQVCEGTIELPQSLQNGRRSGQSTWRLPQVRRCLDPRPRNRELRSGKQWAGKKSSQNAQKSKGKSIYTLDSNINFAHLDCFSHIFDASQAIPSNRPVCDSKHRWTWRVRSFRSGEDVYGSTGSPGVRRHVVVQSGSSSSRFSTFLGNNKGWGGGPGPSMRGSWTAKHGAPVEGSTFFFAGRLKVVRLINPPKRGSR